MPTIETDYPPMTRERAIDYLLQLDWVYRADYCKSDEDNASQRAVTVEALVALGVPADQVKRQYR